MREIFSMWKYTKMVVLVALSAAFYAASLIPFKGFVLIPGFTEIRPASAFPVILGLLFGPAGAWGAAIGNLIGDFFGTLGPGSLFGFIGNFFFAYVPYKVWNSLGLVDPKEEDALLVKGGRKIANFVIAALLGAASCALIIGWGVDLLKLVPFKVLSTIILFNNSIPSIVLGLPMILVLYPRVKKWDLLWTDIMSENEVKAATSLSGFGAIIILAGIVGGLVLGHFSDFGSQAAGIGVAMIILGGLFQRAQ